MSMHAQQRTATSLVSRFHETREDQSRRVLVDAVSRQPDTTMEELAAFVEQHPELSGMTLDELLARIPNDCWLGKLTLADWLRRVPRSGRACTIIPATSGWPETRISAGAARLILGYESAIVGMITRMARRAVRARTTVERVMILSDPIFPGSVAIYFCVDGLEQREQLWRYLGRIEPDLPFELWLMLA